MCVAPLVVLSVEDGEVCVAVVGGVSYTELGTPAKIAIFCCFLGIIVPKD